MAIDDRYIISPVMWQIFTDKDTNDFLFNGYVLFAEDAQRSVGKQVFTISGTYPNYSYVPYGSFDVNGLWRVDLNSQGAFDVPIYLFPYEPDGQTVQLYFIQWFSADDVFQHSLQAWPNIEDTAPNGTPIEENFIADPQFRFNLTPPGDISSAAYAPGQIIDSVTYISWGGVTFNRPISSTADDYVTFELAGSPQYPPSGANANPRFECVIETTSADSSDLYKDVRWLFNDVNKFSDQEYTFGITGQDKNGIGVDVDLVLIKNYGTGGSTEERITLTTFSLTSSLAEFFYTFTFPSNAGKVIGPLNDDYLQLVISLPTGASNKTAFTNGLLAFGDVLNPILTYEPDSVYNYRSIAGFLEYPDTLGANLYLPIYLTPQGLGYDYSEIGKIYATLNDVKAPNELACDGSSYETAAYSSTGIPFSRLQQALANPSSGAQKFGNGTSFFNAWVNNNDTVGSLSFQTNNRGNPTATADGTIPTGFTFTTLVDGSATIAATAYTTQNSVFYIWSDDPGPVTAADAGTSGFLVVTYTNSPLTRQVVLVEVTSVPGAGDYFLFSTTAVDYYVWFKVNGAGADPAVGGRTGILVEIFTPEFNPTDIAYLCAAAIAGHKATWVQPVAVTTALEGAWFSLYTTTQDWYVWFKVDNVGTDPLPVGKTSIGPVALLSTDTIPLVADKIQGIINSKFFAVPDLRGVTLKGADIGTVDSDFLRFSYGPSGVDYGQSGSFQFSQVLEHLHLINGYENDPGAFGAPVDQVAIQGIPLTTPRTSQTDFTGAADNRVYNMYVNYVIKY